MNDFNRVLNFDVRRFRKIYKSTLSHRRSYFPDQRTDRIVSLSPSPQAESVRWSLRTDRARFPFEPAGTKHKTMLEARTGVGSIKSFPRPGVKSKLATTTKSSTGLQNKTFYCETCDVHVNSETQLKQVRWKRSDELYFTGRSIMVQYKYPSTKKVNISLLPFQKKLARCVKCKPNIMMQNSGTPNLSKIIIAQLLLIMRRFSF